MEDIISNTDTFDSSPSALDGRIYTMPSYYLPKAAKSKISQKTMLLIIGGVILVLIVVIFSVILLRSTQTTQQVATPTTPIIETPVVIPPTDEPNETPIEEDPEIIEEPETVDSAITLPAISIPTAQLATDTDQDGLTDAEEALFLTSPAVPDTDLDSFLDGPELVNLYDPSTPGALIEISPQVKIARNIPRGYQMLIPATWTSSLVIPNGDEFFIRPTDGTETFEIEIVDNTDRLTPVQWYQEQELGADLSLFNSFENDSGWNGIRSQDGRVVIATYGSTGVGARAFIFVMHYEPGVDSVLRYSAIWSMMMQSLSLLEEEVPTSGSTTATTN